MSKPSEVYDEKWFAQLTEIYFSDEKWLAGFSKISEKEKIRFLQDEVENPVYSQKTKKTTNLPMYRSALENFRSKIEHEETHPTVRRIYLEKIDRHLNFIPMYKASEMKQDADFFAGSVVQYGKPKKTYFAYIAKRMKDFVDRTEHVNQGDARKKLHRIFSKVDTSAVKIGNDVLPPIVTPGNGSISAESASRIFNETLERHQISSWKIEIDTSCRRTRFAVNSKSRTVYVPCDKALRNRAIPLTDIGVQALAAHEIGVHALRGFNGSNQPLQLLSVGLAKYIKGEEGLASYVQQQVEGSTEYYGFERYLAISLAVGMDGTERDFRSVFEIMKSYFLLKFSSYPDASERAVKGAWQVCEQAFRGTTGLSAGKVYTRDIVYLEGNIEVWTLLIQKPHVFESLFVGKFDPVNQSHVDALVELAIIPSFS